MTDSENKNKQDDKLEAIFSMQSELNDAIFAKKQIKDRNGDVMSMNSLQKEAQSGDLGPNGIVNEWLQKYLQALNDESRELKDELLWKWWSKDKLDMQNIKVEIIDQLHFWVSLALTAGMSPDDIYQVYQQKNAINHKRQQEGYSKANKTEADNKAIKT